MPKLDAKGHRLVFEQMVQETPTKPEGLIHEYALHSLMQSLAKCVEQAENAIARAETVRDKETEASAQLMLTGGIEAARRSLSRMISAQGLAQKILDNPDEYARPIEDPPDTPIH